jgi:hypothetical protein
MGMDVYGEAPQNKKGEYFRNNCWWWRPLWDYVADVCSDFITDKDHSSGHYNDGHLIEKARAERIAARLRQLCESGKVLDFEREYKRHIESLTDIPCDICNGTGIRPGGKEQFGAEWFAGCNGCNGCNGKGTVKPNEAHYPFEAENVLEFAEFAENSGGFRIY